MTARKDRLVRRCWVAAERKQLQMGDD